MSDTQSDTADGTDDANTSDDLLARMEKDAQDIMHNYGRVLEVEVADRANPHQMVLETPSSVDVVDEIISVIVQHGYEIAYIKYNEQKAVFNPRDISGELPEEVDTVMREAMTELNLVHRHADGLTAYRTEGGYEVSMEVIGELTPADITNDDPAYRNDFYEVFHKGYRSGELAFEIRERA